MIEPYSGQKHIRRGVTWNATGLAASKSVGMAAKLILAGLLVPVDFGLVGMTLILTQLVKSVVDLGLRNTLTYHKADGQGRLRYDSVFWLLMLVGVVAVLAMWLVGAPLLVWFYGEPELSGISVAMTLVVLFQNLQLVPEVRLMRAMRFKQIVVAEFVGTLLGSICAVSLALLGAGVWSLVSQWLAAAAGTMFVMFRFSGWRPRLRFSLTLLQRLKGYSSYVLGSRAFTYVQQNLDYLFLGKLLGAHALGIYALAFMVTETLRAHIFLVVSRVVFPVYSRLAGQREGVRPLYLGTVRYMTVTVFPLAMLLVLFAGDAVPVVLPSAWGAAVEPIRILAVASMVMASAGTPGEVLKGVGKPDLDFRINWKVTSFVAFPALWLGILRFGIPGAALAVLFHYCISRVLFHRAIRSVIQVGVVDAAVAMSPACLGILLMTGCAMVLHDWNWIVAAGASSIVYAVAVLPTVLPHFRRQGPPSQVVVIIGPDGPAITSLAQNLAREVPGGKRLYLGMGLGEPWVIPPVRAFYAFHQRRRSQLIRSLTGILLWYLLFPIELIARRLTCAFGRPPALLLIDRLPGRPFLRGGLLLSFYRWLLPRPHAIVLLAGDPSQIPCPKPDETAKHRMMAEMAKWETVASRTGANGVLHVDATKTDLRACTKFLIRRLARSRRSERVPA